MRSRDRQGNAGFLLVETLATMAISAFTLVALLSVASLAMRASQRENSRSQEIESATRVMSSLAREIEQIAPVRWAGAGGAFVFNGSDRSLSFSREAGMPNGGIGHQAVFLRADGNHLYQSEATLLPGNRNFGELVASDPQDLLQGRLQVRFAYFSRLDNGDEALTDTWAEAGQLPAAVRVSLASGDGVVFAARRVQIFVDAEPGCAAPGAACSLAKQLRSEDEPEPSAEKTVDADDQLGWERYAK
jgi:type II secretory pathway component PulJ